MSERRFPDPVPPSDDEAIGRLIAEAGPRPPLPEADLVAIAAAARTAWQARTSASAPSSAAGGERIASDQPTSGPVNAPFDPAAPARGAASARIDAGAELGTRRGSPRTLVLALAAILLVGALGLAIWRATRGPAPEPPIEAARLEAATGAVWIERDGADAERLEVGDAVPAGATLRTGRGAEGAGAAPVRASMRMRNGATVRLDAATAVRLASSSGLDLDGGAVYVATSSVRGGALEVRTPFGTVRDVGTQFIVRSNQPGEQPAALRVLVREGAVAVEREGARHLAAAGEELRVESDGTTARRSIDAYGPDWQWILAAAAPFDPQGRTVAELLEWVASETGWTVRYQDGEVAAAAHEIALRGGGPAWEATWRAVRADEAPQLVLPSADLESELENGTLTIRRKGR